MNNPKDIHATLSGTLTATHLVTSWENFHSKTEDYNEVSKSMQNEATGEPFTTVLGYESSPNSEKYQNEENIRKRNKTIKKQKTIDKKYKRYAKPPYPYVGLIALAIRNSATKMLKLSEILSQISTMFPFFEGAYQGWRDSVRHNLSQNKCFKKVLPNPNRPHSKGNYWEVDLSLIPEEKLKLQNTSVSRNVAYGFKYAKNLKDIFDLETGQPKVHDGIKYDFYGNNVEASKSLPISDPLGCTGGNTHNQRPESFWQNSPSTAQICSCSQPQAEGKTNYGESSGDHLDPRFITHYPTRLHQNDETVCSNQVSSTTGQQPKETQYSSSSKFFSKADSASSDKESVTTFDSLAPTDSSEESNLQKFTKVPEQPELEIVNKNKVVKRKRHLNQEKIKNLRLCRSKKRNNAHNATKNNLFDSTKFSTNEAVPQINSKGKPNSTEMIDNLFNLKISNNLDSNLQLRSNLGNVIPPNQRPFDEKLIQQQRTTTSNSPTWCYNYDQIVGPQGPPNVTWSSSGPLSAIKPLFEAAEQANRPVEWNTLSSFDSNSEKTSISIQNQCMPSEAQCGSTIAGMSMVADQSDFLAEQASILMGRSLDYLPRNEIVSNVSLNNPYRAMTNVYNTSIMMSHSDSPFSSNPLQHQLSTGHAWGQHGTPETYDNSILNNSTYLRPNYDFNNRPYPSTCTSNFSQPSQLPFQSQINPSSWGCNNYYCCHPSNS